MAAATSTAKAPAAVGGARAAALKSGTEWLSLRHTRGGAPAALAARREWEQAELIVGGLQGSAQELFAPLIPPALVSAQPLEAEGEALVSVPLSELRRALACDGCSAGKGGGRITVRRAPAAEPEAITPATAPAGWEWTELDDELSNAAWQAGGGPKRTLSAARYWSVVPDLVPLAPRLRAHLVVSYGEGGAVHRGNWLTASAMAAEPAVWFPDDGYGEGTRWALLMTALDAAGGAQHCWAVANARSAADWGQADELVAYLAPGSVYGTAHECPRYAFRLFAQRGELSQQQLDELASGWSKAAGDGAASGSGNESTHEWGYRHQAEPTAAQAAEHKTTKALGLRLIGLSFCHAPDEAAVERVARERTPVARWAKKEL